jgi:hypothetical protein
MAMLRESNLVAGSCSWLLMPPATASAAAHVAHQGPRVLVLHLSYSRTIRSTALQSLSLNRLFYAPVEPWENSTLSSPMVEPVEQGLSSWLRIGVRSRSKIDYRMALRVIEDLVLFRNHSENSMTQLARVTEVAECMYSRCLRTFSCDRPIIVL